MSIQKDVQNRYHSHYFCNVHARIHTYFNIMVRTNLFYSYSQFEILMLIFIINIIRVEVVVDFDSTYNTNHKISMKRIRTLMVFSSLTKNVHFISKNAISYLFLKNVSPSKKVICFILNNLHFPMVEGIAFYNLHKSRVLIIPCQHSRFMQGIKCNALHHWKVQIIQNKTYHHFRGRNIFKKQTQNCIF